MAVNPIPAGYHSLTPYLAVENAAKLIEFIEKVLGGKEVHERMMKGDKVGHAEMQIGDSRIMIADCNPDSPPNTATLYHYVANADDLYKKAIAAGAKSISEPADMFYGDRHCGVLDPSGNQWWFATRIEDLTPEELNKRSKEFMSAACAK